MHRSHRRDQAVAFSKSSDLKNSSEKVANFLKRVLCDLVEVDRWVIMPRQLGDGEPGRRLPTDGTRDGTIRQVGLIYVD